MSNRRKPTRMHVIGGTHRPDRHGKPEDDVQPEPPSTLDPPAYLDQVGREVWIELAPRLHALGVLSAIDLHPLAAYCAAVATLAKCEREIEKYGILISTYAMTGEGKAVLTAVKKNPALTARDSAARIIGSFAGSFGLTPSARAGLAVIPLGTKSAGKDTGADGEATGNHKEATARRLLDKE